MSWKCPYCGSNNVHPEGGGALAMLGKAPEQHLFCGNCHRGFPYDSGKSSTSSPNTNEQSQKKQKKGWFF